MSTRILLADDHVVCREGLRLLIEKEPGIEVVAEAGNGRETVKLARKLSPDLVIMDIRMPDLNGIEATRQICSEVEGVKVLALSMYSDEQVVIAALNAGACGYLLKNSAAKELVQAIRRVLSDEIYLGPRVTNIVVKGLLRHFSNQRLLPSSPLTPREIEVLQLISEGKTSKEIASELHVSIKAVEAIRHRIMQKLDIHNIANLTKYAIRQGITSLQS
jgi:two-component system response regulator NreC